MDSLKETLMTRDELTEAQAQRQMDDVQEMMMDAIAEGNFCDAEDIFCDEMGLEPDYIMDLLF